jgi:hypothetical protein
MQPQQPDVEHHDPFAEASRGGLEKLMAFGVLAEAGGRYAAERARVQLAREERAAQRDRAAQEAAEKAQRLAAAEQRRRQREWHKLVDDPGRLAEYMNGLPVQEVARHWTQAAAHAGQDRTADTALAAAEKALRGRLPTLMNAYDRNRKAGVDRFEAMRSAVADVFANEGPRANPGKRQLPALDRELEQELLNHAGALDPAARQRWLRAMEARGWSPESVAWAEAMLLRSDEQRRAAAAANASAVDDPATPADERTDGLVATGTATGRADDLARDAAAEAGTAGHPSAQPAGGRAGPRVVRPMRPDRLARLSYATPPEAVLRPTTQPAPAPSRPATPDRTARRGPTR